MSVTCRSGACLGTWAGRLTLFRDRELANAALRHIGKNASQGIALLQGASAAGHRPAGGVEGPRRATKAATGLELEYSCYVQRYKDLLWAYCGGALTSCNWKKVARHWERRGQAEGRRKDGCTGGDGRRLGQAPGPGTRLLGADTFGGWGLLAQRAGDTPTAVLYDTHVHGGALKMGAPARSRARSQRVACSAGSLALPRH